MKELRGISGTLERDRHALGVSRGTFEEDRLNFLTTSSEHGLAIGYDRNTCTLGSTSAKGM